MKVVLDTNLLWVSISRTSSTHWLFKALLDGKFTLCVTTEIISEYEEIIAKKLSPAVSVAIVETLQNLPNVEFTTIYYKWNLISIDPDDNKFVDCAIASASDYIITNDKHFDTVVYNEFPPVNILDKEAFKNILLSQL